MRASEIRGKAAEPISRQYERFRILADKRMRYSPNEVLYYYLAAHTGNYLFGWGSPRFIKKLNGLGPHDGARYKQPAVHGQAAYK